MFNELINTILDAESKAQCAVEKANVQAQAVYSDILQNATGQRKDFALQQESLYKKHIQSVEKEASTAYHDSVKQAEHNVEKFKLSALKNQTQAVEFILKNL